MPRVPIVPLVTPSVDKSPELPLDPSAPPAAPPNPPAPDAAVLPDELPGMPEPAPVSGEALEPALAGAAVLGVRASLVELAASEAVEPAPGIPMPPPELKFTLPAKPLVPELPRVSEETEPPVPALLAPFFCMAGGSLVPTGPGETDKPLVPEGLEFITCVPPLPVGSVCAQAIPVSNAEISSPANILFICRLLIRSQSR